MITIIFAILTIIVASIAHCYHMMMMMIIIIIIIAARADYVLIINCY